MIILGEQKFIIQERGLPNLATGNYNWNQVGGLLNGEELFEVIMHFPSNMNYSFGDFRVQVFHDVLSDDEGYSVPKEYDD